MSSIFTTSTASIRRCRSRTWRSGEGSDCGGQGEALRALGGGSADDSPRTRRATGGGTAKRILTVVPQAGRGDHSFARRTGHRLRPLQPSGQGLPDGKDGREPDLRPKRHPQQHSAIQPGGAQGEPGAGRSARRDWKEQERDTGADRVGVAACAEAVDCSDSGDYEVASAGREYRGGKPGAYEGRPAGD